MKRLRRMALAALVVVSVLAVTPAVQAGGAAPAARGQVLGTAAGWLAGWVQWVTRWWVLRLEGPHATFQANSSCVDPDGSPASCPARSGPSLPVESGDNSSCVDPDGNRVPCAP